MNVLEGTYRSKGIGRRVKNGMAGQGPTERQRMSRLEGERPGRIKLTRVEKWQQEKVDVGGALGVKRNENGKYVSQGRARASAKHGTVRQEVPELGR